MTKDHKISLTTAILMNINMMVGVGAFFGPQLMSQKAGYASFLGWPIVAIIFFPIVFSIATMARIFPGSGSFYSYSKKVINQATGFMSGWMFFLGYAGVAALQTICLQDIVLQYIPALSPILFKILYVVIISSIALLRFPTIGRIQNIGTAFKLLPIIFVLSVFAIYWNPSLSINPHDLRNIFATLPVALFGFWGFECCCTISHLIKGDKKNASRAILIAFFITMTIYTLFHLGLVHIMGVKNLATLGSEDFVQFLLLRSATVQKILTLFVTGSVMLAYANSTLAVFVANSSTLHAMADENLLPQSKKLAVLNKNLRPIGATIAQSALAFAFATAINNKFALTAISNLGVLFSFFLTLIALFLLQKRARTYAPILITALAFISWFSLSYFSWMSIGQTISERLLTIIPLLFLIAIGMGMYVLNMHILKQKKNKRIIL